MRWYEVPPQATSHALAERLLDWSEKASRSGRKSRGEALLLLAWQAYDQSSSDDPSSSDHDKDRIVAHMAPSRHSQHLLEEA